MMARRTLGLVALAACLPFLPFFMDAAAAWRANPYAGHGLFAALFAALLLLAERRETRRTAAAFDRSGLLLIALALGLLAVGQGWRSLMLQSLSLALAVGGVVRVGLGQRCLRRIAFPIGILVLMAPPPAMVVHQVSPHLRLFAAAVASRVLDLLGIPHLQSGVYIALPSLTLEVGEPCDGLRFLMALVTLVAAIAHVSQRSLPRKLALMVAALPIAILANAVRVGAISVAAYQVGPQAAQGLTHHSIGKVVWLLTLPPLLGLAMLLRRGGEGSRASPGQVPEPAGSTGTEPLVAPPGLGYPRELR